MNSVMPGAFENWMISEVGGEWGAGAYKRLRHHCDIKWLCTLNYI